MKRIALYAAFLLSCVFAAAPAFAQSLTAGQVATLRTNILADGVLSPLCGAPVGDAPSTIAVAYNVAKSPVFVVWKSNVTVRETGLAFNGAEWAGMTGANHTRLQTVAQYLTSYNPSGADVRAMFNDIWSGAGGALTRASLLALWKRNATRGEALFATGTGSDAVPAALVFEGQLSVNDVLRACSQ